MPTELPNCPLDRRMSVQDQRRNSGVTNGCHLQPKEPTSLVDESAPDPTTTLATAGAIWFPAAKTQRRSISDFPKFSLTPRPNHLHIPRRPASLRGALRNVTDVGRDAVDAGGALDGRVASGRRSRVVLMPRRWHQVPRKQASCKSLGGEGGKQARSPGRARRKPLKPLRGECRVIPV
jgi:hypothetical protein